MDGLGPRFVKLTPALINRVHLWHGQPPDVDVPNGNPVEGLIPFSALQVEHLDWIVPGLIPEGMLTVLAGQGGLGKSMLECALAAQLSRRSVPTVFVSAEDSPTRVTKARLLACEAEQDLIHHAKERPIFGNGHSKDTIRKLRGWILGTGAKLLLLDPINSFIDSASDTYKDQHVRRVLEPLDELADDLRCAILYVKHFNKGASTDPYDRISDGGGWVNASRSAVVVTAENGDRKSRKRIVAQIKSNNAELSQGQIWEIVPTLLQNINGRDVRTARIEYRGLTDVDIHQLLAPPTDAEAASDLERADDLIRGVLAFGDAPSRDLENAAAAMGITHATMMEARKRAGVVAIQKSRSWYVHLPDPQSQLVRVRPPPDSEKPLQTTLGNGSESESRMADSDSDFGWIGTAPWDELEGGLTDP